MRRSIIILNICFVILFLFFLFLSIFYGSIIGFFFIPILCFLPFAFRKKFGEGRIFEESEQKPYKLEEKISATIRYCPVCKGEIREPIAKFCYHCGSKLNNR